MVGLPSIHYSSFASHKKSYGPTDSGINFTLLLFQQQCKYTVQAPDEGACPPPVLRGECEEVFVFESSGTHELHTINTTYQVATT